MYSRPSPSELIHQEQTKEARDRFEHVVIDLKAQMSRSGEAALVASTVIPSQQGRRRSSLQWITGKVEQLRKKFSPTEADRNEKPLSVKLSGSSKNNAGNADNSASSPLSPSDTIFLKICKKYQKSAENKYCALDFAFDDLITQFSGLLEDIEMIETGDELPRGVLLFPLSEATGLSILDFEQVGGYSLGRGSKLVQRGQENISRSHCLIYLNRDGLAVKDCDSHTGTFVCGRLIGSGVVVPLESFDIVQLGYSQRGPQETVQFLVVPLRNWNGRKFGEQMQSVASPISFTQSPTLSNSAFALNKIEFEQGFEQKQTKPKQMVYEEKPKQMIYEEKPKQVVYEEREPQLIPAPQIQSNVRERRPMTAVTFEETLTIPKHAKESTSMQKQSSPVSAIAPISPWSIATQAEFFEESRLSTPLVTDNSSPTLTEISSKSSSKEQTDFPAPPMRPKTRVTKKNLTKSFEELNAPLPAATQFTVKNSIEVPEILKAAKVNEIPTISPITEWLLSAPLATKTAHCLSIALLEKRAQRLQKMRKLGEFSTLPIGASTVRFENFLDFGLFTSDISDGAARTWRGSSKECIKWAFHNYRSTWELEGIDLQSGTKLIFKAQDRNKYSVHLAAGACEEVIPIGHFAMDVKRRMIGKMVFNIQNDENFNKLSGKQSPSSTLQALRQLSFFYPHLKTPTLLLKGAPSGPESSVHLSLEASDSGESKSVGRVRFENHRISWTKHAMTWATDLDSAVLEAESVLTNLIHGSVLLYCLRYHLD